MKIKLYLSAGLIICLVGISNSQTTHSAQEKEYSGNPFITHIYTADPAALVHGDSLYVYTGHDEQEQGVEGYLMKNWHVFSTGNMTDWVDHGPVMAVTDFAWARSDAWAGHCIEREGKFYWYVPVTHDSINGFSIGVAVADSPIGPFKDAKGSALITNNMTTHVDIHWDDIDPAVFIDDDGLAYIFWGNQVCKYAKLKDNMIDLDSEIMTIELPAFTEAPWIHKKDSLYYLSYAAEWPEKIDYATSTSIHGPWKYRGRINELVENSGTNHQAIVEFKGKWYFIYHNGGLPEGGDFRRSVCIEELIHNSDGTIKPIEQSPGGVVRIP